MKEARFYTRMEKDKVVKCTLCMHQCVIKPGKRGICMVRENVDGTLMSLVYGKLVAVNNDPVEKKPLFHFQPGSKSLSISTVGCNFQCENCQNWQISQSPRLFQGKIHGDTYKPEDIVSEALLHGAKSISYTYVEPTIFYEFAYDTGTLARKRGLKNIFVSNGYLSRQTCKDATNFLDGINIDLKSFSDRFYREVCKARLQPVLDTIELMHHLGIWVEVTTLVIPGMNDSEHELREIARFIKNISPSIPWHVTAFHPTFKMQHIPATTPDMLKRAREIGMEEGLAFVYVGNVVVGGGEDTYCPKCGAPVIMRRGFFTVDNRLKDGKCPQCNESIPGVWA